jgi:ethanolamine utilization protein EutN
VVGNVVATVRAKPQEGYKLMIVQYVDMDGRASGRRYVAFDCVNSGVGDLVIVSNEGLSAAMLLDDPEVSSDLTICGMVDYYTFNSNDLQQ